MTVQLVFKGIVQGIGFRPSALRIARELNISGHVQNSGGSVTVVAQGEKKVLEQFVRRILSVFHIKDFTCTELPDQKCDNGFEIISSSSDDDTSFLTPDLATCTDCERELTNPKNRRYLHPFISCVNCGPRYTIIQEVPYDRKNTSMGEFDLCPKCREEYTNSTDRRCHAQTIACTDCGPVISLPIEKAARILQDGDVLAIKGIGGYHLACRADCPAAVNKIRALKGREKKPFAVMFSSLEQIRQFCSVHPAEEALLLSPARPIVLLDKIREFDESVCGFSHSIGAFLPCNPIQILLLQECSPLVMTSANISGEPIITDDEEIKKFDVEVLSHDRKILTPVDDSVVRVTAGRMQFVRRARGYVPLAVNIGRTAKCDTLCLGGDLKAVFGYHKEESVFLSQNFGDLQEKKCLEAYRKNIRRFQRLHHFKNEKIVADSHPGYDSAALYQNHKTVQHHKAHIASVIAEHRLKGAVLGFAFDGTGFGDDGAVWGSEVLLFDGLQFERKQHLQYVKITGSDEISKNAQLFLDCCLGGNPLIDRAIALGINTIHSSSMGRLFDAVSALLGICEYNQYEGECASTLEIAAKAADRAYPLTLSWNPKEILTQIKNASAPVCELALGFHYLIADLILSEAKKHGVSQIVLSGGCFQNKILTERAIQILEENHFQVYINEKVPCGDGGIALGQAYLSSLEE